MKELEHLHLAALLHDIGKFRMRGTDRFKKHQEHSYEFVNEDFADFFSPCGEDFKNAIRNHHALRVSPGLAPSELPYLDKLVILADRLSASEREDEERESEDFVESALVTLLSRLDLKGEGSDRSEYSYKLASLDFDRSVVIPTESAAVNQEVYKGLWCDFTAAFRKATEGARYTPAFYQTIVALLHKYTSRMPSATPWGRGKDKTVPDISLYDHLRTTAAVAACLGREFTEERESEVDALISRKDETNPRICALIKGDISGIQNFLYQIVSDGASNQLRGRSFYLQLLTETIARYLLKKFGLPVTNLLLASGGHFYILAPYSEAEKRLDALRKTISEKLWKIHQGDLSCMLAGISIRVDDFTSKDFSQKWEAVSGKVQQRKQEKWSEIGAAQMFENFFEPFGHKDVNQGFEKLGHQLRDATSLVTFEVPEAAIPETPDWREAIRAFGLDAYLCKEVPDEKPTVPQEAERAVVYQLGGTDLLKDLEKYQWADTPVSFDFRFFRPVIARGQAGEIADYDALANASDGVQWLGALRMDVDNLGSVFTEKLGESATISRLATLSEAFCLFFEGYVPELCRTYNAEKPNEMLELIYAGGDDLFIMGGWSALPEIAERIRSEFRQFVTDDHITLSGGIAIEHKKYPLYQFAAQSGAAEDASKNLDGKNALTFLRHPMEWGDFERVREWHQKFLGALTAEKPLPRDILTRLGQIYAKEELLEGHRWAWRSLYYFRRLKDRNKNHNDFLDELQSELNHNELRKLVHVITRWTALSIRNKED